MHARSNGGGSPGPRSLAASLAEHRERFRARYPDAAAPRLFFAPGRVNLMGAHLDYNGGPVMPMAIDRGTFAAVAPRADGRVRLASTLEDGALEFELGAAAREPAGRWYDYPLGVLLALFGGTPGRAAPPALPCAAPTDACGLDILFGGNLAIGAGLSSSASICVGTAFVLDRLWGLGCEPRDRARLALWAEREFVGVQCGIMDPYAVGMSRPEKLLWLDCRDESCEHLPFDTETLCIAVADTGVRRELAQGAFNQRVRECRAAFDALAPHAPAATCLRDVPLEVLEQHAATLEDTLARRARHVLEEVARTLDARAALMSGDVRGFGRQMSAAHTSLRELYDVSVAELDCLVEAAVSHPGVLGSRLTGAGFGGCTVVLLERSAREGLAGHLEEAFGRRFGRLPTVGFFGGDPGPREVDA